MRTYQDLFRTREFTPLFLSSALQTAASTVSGLALGTLVYEATDSPLLSALSMFGLTGHALGLHSSGMLTLQGVSAALAGAVAQLTSPAAAMAVMAAVSIAVTLTLWAAGRRAPACGARPPGRGTMPRVERGT